MSELLTLSSKLQKVTVKGKFLHLNNEKFFVKGVTYGTFSPNEAGHQYPSAATIEKDFAMMSYHGINCVRTYTVPPLYLLDIALKYHLKVMIGLPWEQHITFLDTSERKNDIIKRVQQGALSCKGHAAILCFAVGNEIPATIVRWYGKNKVENFLKLLYQAVKKVDPDSLVTYVNFPTTEYLDLSFLDFDCFNVYLETPQKLSGYIARLHNLAGDRPLVLAEIGLDSIRNSEEQQAETLKWQIKTVFARGCAGMFVFAWTDEWWRGGFEIEDWDFGIVDRQRNPKQALHAVSETMQYVPFSGDEALPFISVIVCSYNGSATIRDCMEGIQKLDYPNYEVIVIDDGSKDNLTTIVKEYPVKLISTPNGGLSNARNIGLYSAKGEIIAYIDDDAYPDPHWLRYLAYAYKSSNHSCIGGPNIAPAEDGPIAKCVANAPGGPVHVLFDDELAEHVPGCNMSFRKSALLEIGGFDPVFKNAGDDVDVCWRIQNAGKTIGFHPSALVWHHRRNSIKAYWKQQKGYGKAEALLEAKWPERYNGFGHVAWGGRIYGNGFTLPINLKKGKVFYGSWGTALFQSVYQPANGFLNAIPLMPEWYLFSAVLGFLATLGFISAPFLWVWPLFILSVVVVFIQAVISASNNVALLPGNTKFKYKELIILLHIIQPMARLYGRLKHGLTPWTKINVVSDYKFAFAFKPTSLSIWSEKWRSSEAWLEDIEKNLKNYKARVQRGGDFDRWDIQARNSLFSISRGLLTIEEHGSNKQLVRFRIWPRMSKTGMLSIIILTIMSLLTAANYSLSVSIILAVIVIIFLAEYFKDSASTMFNLYNAFKSIELDETTTAEVGTAKISTMDKEIELGATDAA
ncbi:MAG: glycosyltransferase [Ferruginibacter sp.]|nr:glycosyltransferase [Ferruginibacter sp.]